MKYQDKEIKKIIYYNKDIQSLKYNEKEVFSESPSMSFMPRYKTKGLYFWVGNTNINEAIDKTKRTQNLQKLWFSGINKMHIFFEALTDEQIFEFVTDANKYGIQCCWLCGDSSWVENQDTVIIDRFISYQNNSLYSSAKLSGIHLDVEPNFNADTRAEVLQKYCNMLELYNKRIKDADINTSFEIDISPWYTETDKVTIGGEEKELVPYLISTYSVYVMAYRNTVEEITNVAQYELNMAQANNKQINISLETEPSADYPNITFNGFSLKDMYSVIKEFYTANKNNISGISLHSFNSFVNMS